MNPKFWLFALSVTLVLAACSERHDASIELSGLNYTDVGIATFSVNDYSGHGIFPNGGGGAFVCCITVPRQWHAGMQVTVKWAKDGRVPGPWKERVVEVPKYTRQDIGAFAVHFYPDDIVKVLVTAKMEGHPEYPYPRPN